MTTTKLAKATVIAQAAQAIADHFGIPALKLFSDRPWKGSSVKDARAMLVLYLRGNGMTQPNIARLIRRSEETVRVLQREAEIRLLPAETKLLAVLPKLPNEQADTRRQ